jgi:hypothetical protein
MAKKLAITISGAVSLGSYEAGVLFEIIRTIQQQNSIEKDHTKRVEIDVLTGASAGGMTATIAAQKLLFEATSLQDPYNNSLYRAWVKDVGFDNLFNLESDEDPTHSILSSNHVEAISNKHVMDRYGSQVPPKQVKHIAAADVLYLGLSLSNLNGVDYVRQLLSGGGFTYTRYQDEMVYLYHAATPADDSKAAWDIIRNAAVSCGAFPFAFRTKDLARHYEEYTASSRFLPPIPSSSFPAPNRTFTYTDGGMFQNEPLGLAKTLVDKLDPNHEQNDERFYFYVSPRVRTGTSNSEFNEKLGNFSGTLKVIVAAIFNQGRWQDWIRAEQINEKIGVLDTRAQQLADWIIQSPNNPGLLQPLTDALLPLLIQDNAAADAARARLEMQYRDEYFSLPPGTSGAWIDGILLFETLAGLADKDEMQIFGITASEEKLAGAKLEGFLGFFDQTYRDHDYDVGRTEARDFIRSNPTVRAWFPHYPSNDAVVATGDAAGETWMPIRAIDHSLDGLELKNVPEKLRKQFKDRLLNSADDFLEEIKVPALGRVALNEFFLEPKLNEWLEL